MTSADAGSADWRRYSDNLRSPPSSRLLSTQLGISCILGALAILIFNISRRRFPHIFMARLTNLQRLNSVTNLQSDSRPKSIFIKSVLNVSDKSFLQTLITLHKVTDDEIIDLSGLDAYVFLGFFKMAISLVFVCWLFAVVIISPVRYHFTGKYDQGDDPTVFSLLGHKGDDSKPWYTSYLLIYVVFTYLFTYIACYHLMKHAKMVIDKRQKILGKQNSITDRTIRVSGIPPELRTEKKLKQTIESLHIGKVKKLVICKEWRELDLLFKQRDEIIDKLEHYWASYLKFNDSKLNGIPDNFNEVINLANSHTYEDDQQGNENVSTIPSSVSSREPYMDDITNDGLRDSHSTIESSNSVISTVSKRKRPKIRLGFAGLFGKEIDALDYYTNQLTIIDEEIKHARKSHYPATPTAFVTMDSVAAAQTLAQAVIDPRIGYLITKPAPAPADVIWDNATLPSHARNVRIYYITTISGILGIIFIFPVGYLATLLNYKSIKKFWPDLANLLMKHQWLGKFVIELLPVYLYTLLNSLIPLLYVWLSSKQGFLSHGEEEISVVSKNFFYVFVNLFLVFTMAGTASNYWGYLSDSKQLALQLAQSLRGLSTFYVDTIVLQGIGLMPFKLLPIGKILQFCLFWLTHSTKTNNKFMSTRNPTARELISLYSPPHFNFGLQLPLPLLTLVITLIYSVISTKILSAGLIYFIVGFYVYKFLLLYTYVHPQHSTGKVMPIIFRRVIFGLLLFQLTVTGTLILEKAWVLAVCLTPLPIYTLSVLWYFHDKLKPLSEFISLRAIDVERDAGTYRDEVDIEQSGGLIDDDFPTTANVGDDNASNEYRGSFTPNLVQHLKTPATIDERRERNQSYDYPNLIDQLEGPWIGFDNSSNAEQELNSDLWVLVWTSEGIVRKRVEDDSINSV
ncbi:hypothetical protein CANINC_002135 [Pichia inconspicua]|uniref:CSC1/OSCA1-like 7TM region domain-containing protein n=1 Tax=Pichia inconspicua TaxID=52247 RepID=A0A4T0X1Z6_9ASCO|nr:hypothetical protein CANINC_002135 [[Candida] inconspicua]